MSLLDESLAISTELGMGPLLERVISRQGGLHAQVSMCPGPLNPVF